MECVRITIDMTVRLGLFMNKKTSVPQCLKVNRCVKSMRWSLLAEVVFLMDPNS